MLEGIFEEAARPSVVMMLVVSLFEVTDRAPDGQIYKRTVIAREDRCSLFLTRMEQEGVRVHARDRRHVETIKQHFDGFVSQTSLHLQALRRLSFRQWLLLFDVELERSVEG